MASLAELLRNTKKYQTHYDWFVDLARNFHDVRLSLLFYVTFLQNCYKSFTTFNTMAAFRNFCQRVLEINLSVTPWYLKLKFVSNTFWTKIPKSSRCGTVIRVIQPAPSMTFYVYNDPSKMVYNDLFQFQKGSL